MKLVIYRTRRPIGGGYRWRLVADNGRTLANGGQGYSRRIDMEKAIERVTSGYFSISGEMLWLRPSAPGGPQEGVPVEDRTR